jgi:hypothetical protein
MVVWVGAVAVPEGGDLSRQVMMGAGILIVVVSH